MRTRYAALAATFVLAAAVAATILLTSCSGPQPTSALQQPATALTPRCAREDGDDPHPSERCTTVRSNGACICAVYKGAGHRLRPGPTTCARGFSSSPTTTDATLAEHGQQLNVVTCHDG